ncbi:MAG TPA: xanthine dehydrogenase family protein subunit M [Vicinamibacterales bacterium]|nr:xanthine dehydrogenase family protein subunit M [Vicinamibacterales bacterium]
MKPAPFEYHQARSLPEALTLLAEHAGDAKPLAGGQSLIPAMNFRLAAPAVLVDLNGVGELAYIKDAGDGLRVGAMTRHVQVERSPVIASRAPLLAEAMPFVAHVAIRTRGTIGGSLAHADPAAELPALMLAMNARFRAQNRERSREIAATEFFTGLFSTSLEPGELLTEIAIPAPAGHACGSAFLEFSRRRGDFALAGVAVTVAIDAQGTCTDVRIALFGVGDRPLLASRAAASLVGQKPGAEAIRAAAHTAATDEIDPSNDIHASSRYRRQLADVLTRRALERAFDRAKDMANPR